MWLNCAPMFLILIALAQLPSHLISFSPLMMEVQVKYQFKHNRSTFSVIFPTESTMDYGPLNELLMFYACETRKCVNVTITDDEFDEFDESFPYHLRRTTSLDPRIELDPVDGRIEIVDNDGK